MRIETVTQDIASYGCDVLIVNLFSGVTRPGGATGAVDAALGGAVSDLIAAGEITGKRGEWTLLHTMGKLPSLRVAVLGLGKQAELSTEVIRSITGDAARACRGIGARRVATIVHGAGIGGIDATAAAQAIVEGAVLGLYTFDRHKASTDKPSRAIEELVIVENDPAKKASIEKGIAAGRIIAESTCIARNMINEPSNFMTPADMAAMAVQVGKDTGIEVQVLERDEMERLGMGAILAVSRGTATPPKLIVMSYRGLSEDSRGPVGLIGKGVTFDSGGISLKPAAGMGLMKTDMAGGAVVISAMRAIGFLRPAVNVIGLIPCAENMPSGTAQKPGDVLTTMSGKTVEVDNTDAEGRLLLADAIAYGRRLGVSQIIDVATLTGAMRNAFGDVCTGAFTNDQPTFDALARAAEMCGERLWQMPMFDEYREQNRSDVADIKNTGGSVAGAIAAAWFLREFVEATPWVHLDIAGTARRDSTKGYQVKGASGAMVRTLVQYAVNMSDKHNNG